MQKTRQYKRCLRAAAFAVALSLPLCGIAETYSVVKGGMLNLRKEASLESSVLGQYPSGTWMTVLDSKDGWSKVEVNGKTGYVVSKYLTDAAAGSTVYVRTNTGAGLNLRTKPSLTGDIITSFKTGTAVKVLAKGNGWYHVDVDGTKGYMNSRYLTGSASAGTSGSVSVGYPKQGVVSNPGANQVLLLREKASTDARVIGYYHNGVEVKLTGENGNFYKVTVDGKNGFMMKKYIKTAAVSAPSALPAAPFAAKLINPNGNSIVNFRKAPGLSASIIKAYPVGTEINVKEVGDVWCKVEIDGVEGFVSRYFFSPSK